MILAKSIQEMILWLAEEIYSVQMVRFQNLMTGLQQEMLGSDIDQGNKRFS